MDTLILGEGYNCIYIHLGALSSIDISKFTNFVGCGNSSLLCIFLSLGFSIREIMEIYITKNLLNNIYAISDNFLSLLFHNENYIFEEIEEILISKLGFSPTVNQLYNSSGKKLFFSIPNETDRKIDFIDYTSDENVIDVLKRILINNIMPKRVVHESKTYINGLFNGNIYPLEMYRSIYPDVKYFGIKIETIFNEKSDSVIKQFLSIFLFSIELEEFDDSENTLTIKSYVNNNLKNIELKEIAGAISLGYKSINEFLQIRDRDL